MKKKGNMAEEEEMENRPHGIAKLSDSRRYFQK